MVLTGSMLVRRFSGKIMKTMKEKKKKAETNFICLGVNPSPWNCRRGSVTESLPRILQVLGNAQDCRLRLQERQACLQYWI